MSLPEHSFIVEVGTSSGGVLYPFMKAGHRVFGMDYDSDYMRYARDKGIAVEEGGLHTVKLPQAPDVIIYSHVLEHVRDIKKELKKIRDVLSEDGFLYIEVPGIKNIGLTQSYLGDFLLYLQNVHLYNFTLKTLTNLLESSGFELVVGDEYIRSLFRKRNKKKWIIKNDYEETINFLRSLEDKHKLIHIRIFRYTLNKLLKAKPLLKISRRIYEIFFRKVS